MQAVPPPPPSGGSSTTQIIAIVILVIIAIVLFVVFIVLTVEIPIPNITPFADGTSIRIKSLANNLYLQPIACADISNTCNSEVLTPTCEVSSNNVLVVATGQPESENTRWQLCQISTIPASQSGNTGEAKYVIYQQTNSGTLVMNLSVLPSGGGIIQILRVINIGAACPAVRTTGPICGGEIEFDPRNIFSFILNEKAVGTGSTTSGSYQITTACDPTVYLACTGQGTTCPPFVVSNDDVTFNGNCPTIDDPRCALTLLFEIETVS